MFITKEKNEFGIYCINLCIDGKYKQYIIDDFFPYDNRLLLECCSHGKKGTIWVQILEKCYAKALGCYTNLELNDLDKIIKDLTCAPVVSYDKSLKSLFVPLEEAFTNDWLILAGVGDTDSSHELLKEIGLIPSHAYTIIGVYRINEEIRPPEDVTKMSEKEADTMDLNILLKIRNHWNKDGWVGDWSDEKTNWTEEVGSIFSERRKE